MPSFDRTATEAVILTRVLGIIAMTTHDNLFGRVDPWQYTAEHECAELNHSAHGPLPALFSNRPANVISAGGYAARPPPIVLANELDRQVPHADHGEVREGRYFGWCPWRGHRGGLKQVHGELADKVGRFCVSAGGTPRRRTSARLRSIG